MNNIFANARTNAEILEVIGRYYVRLERHKIYFPRVEDEIDFSRPIPDGDLVLELKDKGLSCRDGDINRLIFSSRIEVVTILDELYSQIPNWDGRDRICEMIRALNLKGDFNLNKTLFEKWLMTAYSMAFYNIDRRITWHYYPRVVLILHSNERGFGKTGFFRRILFDGLIKELIPKLDLNLYAEQNGQLAEDKLERDSYLADCLGINMDDIDETLLDKKNEGKLRSILTSKTISNRQMYNPSTQFIRRKASICGTSNNKTLLRDQDENRYLVFSVEKMIDFRVLDEDDFAFQLWSQIRELAYEKKDDSNFSKDELIQVIGLAQDYIYKTDLEEFFYESLEFEPKGTMKHAEIKNLISRNGYYVPTDNKISEALKRMTPKGFSYKRKSDREQFYNFREINYEKKGKVGKPISAGDGLPF